MRQLLAFILALLLIPLQLPAREKKPKPDSMRSVGLKVYVLEGQNAVNSIPDHKAITPVVEVRDDNAVPVENVSVEFRLPESGSGGQFEDGKHVKTVLTNTAGQAQAPFVVNDKPGPFTILATAKIDTRMGSALIYQANSRKTEDAAVKARDHRWYKDWRILALIGAGVAVTTVLLVRNSGSSTATTVVLTPGGPTFGAPH